MSTTWQHPTKVDDVTLAFPARLDGLLPPMDEIPDDYPHRRDWEQFVSDWFFGYLPADTEMHTAEGIDAQMAGRHLRAILGSYAPKHEHKMAAAAWLSSLWFDHAATPDGSYRCPNVRQETTA